MMIPHFRIGYVVLLACLLLVASARAQEVMIPSTSNPSAVPNLPTYDNPPAAAPNANDLGSALPAPPPDDPNSDTDVGPPSKYVKPTWPNLIKAMIRYNAYDVSDEELLNEYAEISDCEIFAHFYQNDFEWHKVKTELREYLRQQHDQLPTFFHYDIALQFGHYDFDKNMYFFTDKSKISNVNSFQLMRATGNPCPKADMRIRAAPQIFHAVVNDPVGIYGIPMTQQVAQALFDMMAADKNTDHLVHARFNLHVTYIAPMEKHHENGISGRMLYFQMGKSAVSVRFDCTLDSVDFYEDAAMTRLIWRYEPTATEQIPVKPPVAGPPAPPTH
jgi:Domain of unknown function (DUF4852)